MTLEKLELEKFYIECPDHECEYWYNREFDCKKECPYLDQLEKVMRCDLCEKLLTFPLDKSELMRIDHYCENAKGGYIQFIPGGTIITRHDLKDVPRIKHKR